MGLKEARADSREIMEKFSQLGGVGNARLTLQGEQANARTKGIVNEILKEGKGGQCITRVMRLPARFAPALLEYMLGSPPYSQDHPSLQVTLKNTGVSPVSIHTSYEWFADQDENGNELESGYAEEHRVTIEPGAKKTVSPQAAVHALYDRCKDAWPVTEAGHSWPGIADDLVEVGYSCIVNGDAITKRSKGA